MWSSRVSEPRAQKVMAVRACLARLEAKTYEALALNDQTQLKYAASDLDGMIGQLKTATAALPESDTKKQLADATQSLASQIAGLMKAKRASSTDAEAASAPAETASAPTEVASAPAETDSGPAKAASASTETASAPCL